MRAKSTTRRHRLLFCAIPLLLNAFSVTLFAQCPTTDVVDARGGYVKNCGSSKVIVFVHGLFSSPEVWRNETTHAYWPKMVADDSDAVFSDTDVYVAGYDTPSTGNSMTMDELESQIVTRLDRDNVFTKHKEIIFIAHSMGGLLVQQILLTYRDRAFSEKVHYIFLYGTPQEGSKMANWAKLFIPDPKLDELKAGDNNFVLHDVDQRWLHSDFTQIERYCAYEIRKEKGFKIVDRFSATRGCKDTIGIDADHHHLVEPADRASDAYSFVKNHLKLPISSSKADGRSSGTSNEPNGHVRSQTPPFGADMPYLKAERAQKLVEEISDDWTQQLMELSREFYQPYKYGAIKGPPPTLLPDNLLERLAAIDRNITFRYMASEPSFTEVREEAVSCMNLTQNQKDLDRDQYRAATASARTPTPIHKLENDMPDANRFWLLKIYMTNLVQKLGDYHCGTQP